METETATEAAGSPSPEPRRSWKRVAVVAGVFALLAAALFVGAMSLAGMIGGPSPLDVEPGLDVEVTVEPGASARSIAAAIEDAGVVSARDLQDEIDERGVAAQLKAGTYRLLTGMPAAVVVDLLLAGPNTESVGSVIIREGSTVDEVLQQLAEQTGHPEEEFRSVLLDGTVSSPYLPASLPPGVDPMAAWEGLLFPARYQLATGETPAQILSRLSDEMVDRVERLDWSRLDALGVSRYEAMIVASLVEREAGVEEDRPLIASVIYNRLQAGMPLQIDATVIYALGENPGRVLGEHLEVDSPYNTYRIAALPPTPIGTMRQASLEAAADPANTDYLYYVLVSADGTHGFSETYEEHQAKVEQARADGVLP